MNRKTGLRIGLVAIAICLLAGAIVLMIGAIVVAKCLLHKEPNLHSQRTSYYLGSKGQTEWNAWCDQKGTAKVILIIHVPATPLKDRYENRTIQVPFQGVWTFHYKEKNSDLIIHNDRILPTDCPMLIIASKEGTQIKQHVTQEALTTELNRLSSLQGEELFDHAQTLLDQQPPLDFIHTPPSD